MSKCDRAPRRLGHTERGGGHTLTLDASAELHMPVLVLRGETSTILEPDAAQRFAHALPEGELKVVPNFWHNVHSQNTLGFLEAVRPFLKKHANQND